MSDESVTATVGLAELVAELRRQVHADQALAGARTWRTADGEVTVDYRVGDWLRITFRGDAPERTHVLPPDWRGR